MPKNDPFGTIIMDKKLWLHMACPIGSSDPALVRYALKRGMREDLIARIDKVLDSKLQFKMDENVLLNDFLNATLSLSVDDLRGSE